MFEIKKKNEPRYLDPSLEMIDLIKREICLINHNNGSPIELEGFTVMDADGQLISLYSVYIDDNQSLRCDCTSAENASMDEVLFGHCLEELGLGELAKILDLLMEVREESLLYDSREFIALNDGHNKSKWSIPALVGMRRGA
jgi:hypothetical protein